MRRLLCESEGVAAATVMRSQPTRCKRAAALGLCRAAARAGLAAAARRDAGAQVSAKRPGWRLIAASVLGEGQGNADREGCVVVCDCVA